MKTPWTATPLVAFAVMWTSLCARATEFHVTPDGTPAGEGTVTAPWDIATALAHPEVVQPGDTIWLHGGNYPVNGSLSGNLTGSAEQPIIVRQAPGERAVLDTGASQDNRIAIRGSYTWYWGFEVMSSSVDRWGTPARGQGIDVYDSAGIKLINLVVHDALSGVNSWSGAVGSETYGCLVYFTGWDNTDRGHGHAIYTQNISGTKWIEDNIFFAQYSHGIHAYTEGGQINDFHLEGNIGFENGVISTVSGPTRNILIGGVPVADNPVLVSNFTFFRPGGGTSCDLGYGAGTANAQVTGNVLVGPSQAFRIACANPIVSGNLFFGPASGVDQAGYPDNQYYLDIAPTDLRVEVRPNRYDSGRAHIVVFNWSQADQVPVDPSGVLIAGDTFELRDAQNYFGTPALEGTFDGNPLGIPMNLTEASAPTGTPATPYVHTGRDFGAFVLIKTGSTANPDDGSADSDPDDAGFDPDDEAQDAGIDEGSKDEEGFDPDGGGGDPISGSDGVRPGGCGCGASQHKSPEPSLVGLFWVACLLQLYRRRKAFRN